MDRYKFHTFDMKLVSRYLSFHCKYSSLKTQFSDLKTIPVTISKHTT